MADFAQPRYEGRAMSGPPDPDDAEGIADADLETLDAMAEALLDAIIQSPSDDGLPPLATPPGPGRGPEPEADQ
jgi:hypothetical protein